MLSLHQLRCFLATYEQGSLTAAAEQLGYAQPSVSEQIRSLEKTVGASLIAFALAPPVVGVVFGRAVAENHPHDLFFCHGGRGNAPWRIPSP